MKRNAFYFYSSVLPPAITFLVNFLFSRNLSLSEYGIYGVYYPLFNLLMPFLMCGQANAITMQYFAEKRDNHRTLSVDFTQAIYIMGACFVAYGFILGLGLEVFKDSYFADKKIELILLLSIAAFGEAIKQFFYSLANCLDDYKLYFWSTNIQAVVFLTAFLFSLSLSGLFGALLLANLSSSFYLFMQIRKKYEIRLLGAIETRTLKLMFWLGVPSILSMFLSSAFLYSDRFIINSFNPAVFPHYVLASSLAVGIGALGISSVLKGQSIRSLQFLQLQDYAPFRKILQKTEVFLLALAGLSFFFNYIWGKDLLRLIFGSKFDESFQYIAALCFSVIILSAAQFYSLVLIQMKKFNQLVLLQMVALGFNVLFSYLLSRFFRVEFILVSFLVTNCFYFLMIYFLAEKNHRRLQVPQMYFPKYLFAVTIILFGFVFKGHFIS